VLEECFTDILRAIKLDGEVIGLVADALRHSHADQKRFHEEAVARLQAEYSRVQNRLDRAYEDKLDGHIDAAVFDRKAAEWRAEQDRLLRAVAEHQQANQSYMEEGVLLLELAGRAADLFTKQPPREKQRLLDFVLSNCIWANGRLAAEYRQPFDLLAVTNETVQKKKVAGLPRRPSS
jgi:site-specific DNA recombinase